MIKGFAEAQAKHKEAAPIKGVYMPLITDTATAAALKAAFTSSGISSVSDQCHVHQHDATADTISHLQQIMHSKVHVPEQQLLRTAATATTPQP
jgi:hypothetical protein